jgi:hypothetical protein
MEETEERKINLKEIVDVKDENIGKSIQNCFNDIHALFSIKQMMAL